MIARTQLRLFGLPLPVTAEEETFRFWSPGTTERSPEKAEAQAKEILTAYLHTLVDENGSVTSTLCASKQDGDLLRVTLTAECVERIGVRVPIYTDTNSNDPDG